ncbi:galactose-1-epimerase [Photobacterium gaetbulicola]|uniref:Aldose 1-epimerase n=1 Tax=Photobacterium gaetbulicola Gung47 TaxID=658445 RepID=A0A0C5WRM4_9GAMM|nr:galactose-1-epimerase [Photobacterium gaetbulicola]AJR09012.1 aldose 1-epimerase [Photobacterium gaetbulicola Gung47]PSU13569.1 galactose-1-epimerase [Photobacterium gaetbulicola]
MTLPHKVLALHETMTMEAAFDGRPANLFTLTNEAGMTATFMDIGATWLSCTVPVDGDAREVLLGCANMTDHLKQSAYFGATVGRYANRIAGGQFTNDGKTFHVSTNQAGNTLHGGPEGFDQRRWALDSRTDSKLAFCLFSQDGDQGFPGNLEAKVTFELTEDNTVAISYQANCDKPCPVNFTNHAYFNLVGEASGEDCLGHELTISADRFVPTSDVGIPTGELKSVAQTGFDFRKGKTIAQDLRLDPEQVLVGGYDHALLLKPEVCDGISDCVKVISPDQKITMMVQTTKPAVQLYTGNFLSGTKGTSGEYRIHQGFCLETEYLPDAPNHPEWPGDSILRPNQTYAHYTGYRFIF